MKVIKVTNGKFRVQLSFLVSIFVCEFARIFSDSLFFSRLKILAIPFALTLPQYSHSFRYSPKKLHGGVGRIYYFICKFFGLFVRHVKVFLRNFLQICFCFANQSYHHLSCSHSQIARCSFVVSSRVLQKNFSMNSNNFPSASL